MKTSLVAAADAARIKRIEAAAHAIAAADEFGPLHIAVSDGNIDDSHMAFCAKNLAEEPAPSEADRKCLEMLQAMPVYEREAAWVLANSWDFVPRPPEGAAS